MGARELQKEGGAIRFWNDVALEADRRDFTRPRSGGTSTPVFVAASNIAFLATDAVMTAATRDDATMPTMPTMTATQNAIFHGFLFIGSTPSSG